MAITFAVRGDSLDARYSNDGASPGILGPYGPAEITTDNPGINGSTSIDMEGTFLTARPLVYNGRLNTPSGLARTVIMRVKFATVGTAQGLFGMGTLYRLPGNYIGATLSAGGEIDITVSNEAGQSFNASTTGAAITAGAWYDIVCSWNGTTDANKVEVWVNGTRRLQATSNRGLPSPYNIEDQLACSNILIGADQATLNAHFSLDEFVVDDTQILDPTSVTLTSGTGSLNGASRTAYIDVAAFDGATASGAFRYFGTGLFGA